ncbi:arsenate reductase ArsC [Phenylobacterium sp.]|uniref:arsenate reductase ArsC n=1 Tax=Phenylobacterium sp. TaxID=1871053 RepID=UPI0030F3865F
MSQPLNVLFLCTGNSARSIMAEALMNHLGAEHFRAFSAGSMPKGEVNPHALPLVRTLGFRDEDFRSKPWDEFAVAGAPVLDFVITVCDNAAGEVCPVWPGQPITAHWGVPDPAAATGSQAEIAVAFRDAARQLRTRIELLLALPTAQLDRMSLQRRVRDIGTINDTQPA